MSNITISSEIITILDDLSKRFDIAINWADENILPYLTELANKYVQYFFWSRTICLTVAFIIGFLLIVFPFKYQKKHKLENDPYHFCLYDFVIGLIILGIVILVITFITTLVMIPGLVACNVFPEKIIIDYLQNLLN